MSKRQPGFEDVDFEFADLAERNRKKSTSCSSTPNSSNKSSTSSTPNSSNKSSTYTNNNITPITTNKSSTSTSNRSTPKSSNNSSTSTSISSTPKKSALFTAMACNFDPKTNPYNKFECLPVNSNSSNQNRDSMENNTTVAPLEIILTNINSDDENITSVTTHVSGNTEHSSVDNNINSLIEIPPEEIFETPFVTAVFPGEVDLCTNDKKVIASYFKDEFEKGLISSKMRFSVEKLQLVDISREVFCNSHSRRHIIDNYIKQFAWSDLNRTIDKKGVTWESLMNSITEPKKELARTLTKTQTCIAFNDEISSISFLLKLSSKMEMDAIESVSMKSGLIATWKHSLNNNASALFKVLIQDIYGLQLATTSSESIESDDEEAANSQDSDSSFGSDKSSGSSSEDGESDADSKSTDKSESSEGGSDSDGDGEDSNGESKAQKKKKKKEEQKREKKRLKENKNLKTHEKSQDGEWNLSSIAALSRAPTKSLRKIFLKKEGIKLDALTVHLLSLESTSNDFEQTSLYNLIAILVTIVLTTASPLQLSKTFCVSPVDSPAHITCIVGNFVLYSMLLDPMLYSEKFKHMKTITFLLPDICNNEIATFTRYVIHALNDTIKVSRVRNISYKTKKEGRKIITFTRINVRKPSVLDETSLIEMRLRIDKAMDHVTKMFPDLPGGVHALPREEIHLLIAHLGVMDGDTFWEIGVGLPYLAFALSAAAKNGVVLATDLKMQYDLMKMTMDIYYNQSVENQDGQILQVTAKSISTFNKPCATSPPLSSSKRKVRRDRSENADRTRKKLKVTHSSPKSTTSSSNSTPKSAISSRSRTRKKDISFSQAVLTPQKSLSLESLLSTS